MVNSDNSIPVYFSVSSFSCWWRNFCSYWTGYIFYYFFSNKYIFLCKNWVSFQVKSGKRVEMSNWSHWEKWLMHQRVVLASRGTWKGCRKGWQEPHGVQEFEVQSPAGTTRGITSPGWEAAWQPRIWEPLWAPKWTQVSHMPLLDSRQTISSAALGDELPAGQEKEWFHFCSALVSSGLEHSGVPCWAPQQKSCRHTEKLPTKHH